MATQNKGLAQPASASLAWDVPLNSNFGIIDNALGGNSTITVTGASGTIALTSGQYQNLYLIFSGTLTANLNHQLPSTIGGQWVIYNNTTGAFTLTISSAGGGSTVVTEQGKRTLVVCDGTNVALSITTSSPLPVASGGTGVTTSTGTGSVVLSNSPTLVTPTLGAATATSLSSGSLTSSGLTSTATLTVSGSATIPGWNFLSSYTVTSASSQAIPLSTSYQMFRITLLNVTVNSAVALAAQFSSDGGATYYSSTVYQQNGILSVGGTATGYSNTAQTNILLSSILTASNALNPWNGVYSITPGNTNNNARILGISASGVDSTPVWVVGQYGGSYAGTTPVLMNYLKVFVSSGTMSGTILLEGFK